MADAQRKLEAFRARQYGGPHPAVAAQQQQQQHQEDGMPAAGSAPHAVATKAAAPAAAPAAMEQIEPDTGRCVLHFDIDCFYAQVEEVRDPSLHGRPVGVTQKYLVVTANYAARQQGVGKLVNVAEARRRCPSIMLVSGEDLTPYRAASKQIQTVLRRFGPVEKLGLDEFYLDATPEAQRRLAALRAAAGGGPVQLPAWRGHMHSSTTQLKQESQYRPMDLRAVGSGTSSAAAVAALAASSAVAGAADPASVSVEACGGELAQAGRGPGASDGGSSWEALLRLGSVIAAEARAAVLAEAGYRASAGIAANKLLAKLCSGLHKPNDQTVLPPPEAADFVAPLPVRALTGVGHKTEEQLQALGVSTAVDLRALPRAQLVAQFGERVGALLHGACRGKDPSAVQERGPPKSITVEDSFKSCASFAAAEKVVQVLAPDLLARLQEELQEEGRRPATLTVKWRLANGSYQRSSASCHMPAAVLGRAVPQEQQTAALSAAALGLLQRNLRDPFNLSLINIGASGFSEGAAAAAAGTRDIASMLGGARQPGETAAAAAAGAGGSAAGKYQQQQQQAQQQAQHLSMPLQQQPSLPAAGRAAAEASAEQRRSYSGAPQQAPLLPKRLERQLREQPQQGQQAQQAQQTPAAAATAWQSVRGRAQPQQEAQHGARQAQRAERGIDVWGFRGGWGDELQHEEAEDDFWGDLQSLHSWHGGGWAGSSRRQPSPTAAPPPMGEQRSNSSELQQLQQPTSVGKAAAGLNEGSATAAAASAGVSESGGRVVLHCDVDSFYVAVERLDNPSLCGVPLAVQQFNSGGFVAVSYEARAAGIRCGDGAGAAGRAVIPHLVRMQAASMEECRRRCPGLVVRPMRTDRYREVAQQIHALLRTFAPDGQVEKTSYDDFYLDVTAACSSDSTLTTFDGGSCTVSAGAAPRLSASQPPPEGLLFLPSEPSIPPAGQQQQQEQLGALPPADTQQAQQAQQHLGQLAPDLRRGVQLGAAVRAALKQQLGITLSCGVARNKLLARLASPCGKPDGLAVVPDGAERAFIAQVPLRKVPQLRGKFGEAVATDLGVNTVGQLAGTPRHELVRRFGEQRGAFLAALPLAQDDTPVRERGPQKSLAAERSFPPLPSEAAAAAELAPLAQTLLARAAEDTRDHGRLPAKLVVSYRQGYGSNPRSKSGAVPAEALSWLQATQAQPQPGAAISEPQLPPHQALQAAAGAAAGQAGAEAAVMAATLALLRPAVASSGWQLTRLAVAFAYSDGSSSGSGQQHAAPPPGQRQLGAFVQRSKISHQAIGSGEQAAPHPVPSQQQQPAKLHLQPAQQPQLQTSTRPASYRNAEALALQQLFGSSGGGGSCGSSDADAVPAVPAALSAEERASLELALRLQQEEARAAAQAAARKRGAAAAGGGGKAGAGMGRPKQQRRGSGPLDAFLKRPGT